MAIYGEHTLAKIALEAAGRPAWASFARYCELRGRGVRPAALAALETFLAEAVSWPFEARLEFLRWFVDRAYRGAGDAPPAVAPEPLVARLIGPTAREWVTERPDLAEAQLAAGLLALDDRVARYREALRLDPDCDHARLRLVEGALGDIDYNQHHMPDFYIHDPRIDLRDLGEVQAWAKQSSDGDWKAAVLAEIEEKRAVAQAWLAGHPREGDFATS
jgi:hypothetical protein